MPEIPYARQQEIVRIIKENNLADIPYLSKLLNVSEMTIRRDLEKLEKDGHVMRVYGGAKLRSKSIYEAPLEERLVRNIECKRIIAKKAAEFIDDGDVIALDASTTALEISKQIKDRQKLTVITNNISIAYELAGQNDITIMLLGGTVRKNSLSLVGSSIVEMLKTIYIDKGFISSKAMSFDEGLTDATIDEGEAKKAMIGRCKNVFITVDHTKINEVSFIHVCNFVKMYKIITDGLGELTQLQENCLQSFREKGIEVIITK